MLSLGEQLFRHVCNCIPVFIGEQSLKNISYYLKADPEPPQKSRKLNPERPKLQKTAKVSSPACVLPAAKEVPPVNLPKEEPAPAVKKEEPHGLGLTWESF